MSRGEGILPVQRPGTARATRPPLGLGIATSVLSVAAATAAIYPLKNIAPAVSLSVVYLPAVLLVSAYWGLPLGLFTSLLGAGAFNFFHLPPVGHFAIADGRNWWALGAFMLVAGVVSTMAEVARNRAVEAERRRAEPDLAAALARELLAGSETADALAGAARRVAEALALSSASIELGAAKGDERRRALALTGADGSQIATLLVPRELSGDAAQRLRTYVLPALGALVAIGLPVSVHVRRSGSRVVARVVDQGPGIGPGERARIFEPFYRGPASAGEPWSGSGLGLAIAKGFVEANGGTISVDSLPGQGSSFVVSLPIEPAQVADQEPQPASSTP